MFDWLRRIVAGAKNRTVEGDYDLDLTYITDRIVAMAFPASGLEQTVRNCIGDVSSFLTEKHQQFYYIINVSGRSCNIEPFGGRVKQYSWADHQAPCLNTLFQIVDFVNQKLKEDEKNVVVVHCNHGKGRTGTAIMSILMFNNPAFTTVQEVLTFYNFRRFSKSEYKVEQPCQLRYLSFFKKMLDSPHLYKTIKAFKLKNVVSKGLNEKHFLKIISMRNQQVVLSKVDLLSFQGEEEKRVLMGDIFIEIKERGVLMDIRVARINYHLGFLEEVNKSYLVSFRGIELAIGKCQSQSFSLTLQFQQFCSCHKHPSPGCPAKTKEISKSLSGKISTAQSAIDNQVKLPLSSKQTSS